MQTCEYNTVNCLSLSAMSEKDYGQCKIPQSLLLFSCKVIPGIHAFSYIMLHHDVHM